MAAKSIVEVEIRDEQFRGFYEMFQKYQKQLDEMPEGWEKVAGVIDDAGDGMKSFAKASMSSKDFMMIAAIQADAISKAMQKATGVQDKFNTRAKDGAIQMGKMAKASKEMHKDISTMSSVLLKLSAVGGSILTLPAAVLASTNALAGQNVQARGLGLRIGQTQAFEANFEKYGLNASDLANTANAQGDMSKWGAYLAAGLSPSQIQNEDAEQLTYDYYKAASSKFREWQKSGAPAASLAQSYGFTNQFSLQQLRAGASYSDADLAASQQKELEDARKNAVDQATADKASDVKASLKSDWAQVMNTFNDQMATASPELKLLGDSAAAAAVNLLKVAGPEAKAVLDALEGPPISRSAAGQMYDSVVGGFAKFGYAVRDRLGVGRLPNPSVLENAQGLPFGLLAAQAMAESSGNPNAKSPKGALGLMQFMGPTARQYGVDDPTDPAQAIRGASYYDRDLLKRYGGDIRKALAAYNWGMGNAKDPRLDADIAKNGANWEAHIPAATEAYINKVVGLMAKQGQTVNINITNSTTANVATSMNASPH
jgi:soluble lytic murein transglycosylase-like protein